MDKTRSLKFIQALTQTWGSSPSLNLHRLLDTFEQQDQEFFDTPGLFEFSMNSKTNDLRLLHLRFFDPQKPFEDQKLLCKERFYEIYRLFHFISATHGLLLEDPQIKLLENMFKSVSMTNWPLQFGCSLSESGDLRLKAYVSVIHQNHSTDGVLKSLGQGLNIPWQTLNETASHYPLDAIGIDFGPRGAASLKLYPYLSAPFDKHAYGRIVDTFHDAANPLFEPFLSWIKNISLRHIGFLYRITESGTIGSTKIWARLENAVAPSLLPPLEVKEADILKWWNETQTTLENCKASVSYLTLEHSALGVYFR